MVVLLQEYIGSHVKIKSYENELLVAGVVNKIEGERIEIGPEEERKLPTLLYELPVKICLHAKKREDLILGGVVYRSNKDFLVIFDVKLLEEIEQRNYFRVTTGTEGIVSGIASPLHQEIRRLDEADQKLVWVIGVSLTGAQFIADMWLELGGEYLIRFELGDRIMTLCMKIQHVAAKLDKPIEYGCLFFDVHEREEVELCRCLYQIQMVERRRKLNMIS